MSRTSLRRRTLVCLMLGVFAGGLAVAAQEPPPDSDAAALAAEAAARARPWAEAAVDDGRAAGARAGVEREIHVPAGWEGAYEFGYAPVVRVGDQVIVSGIPAGGEGTYEQKVRRMYERAVDLLTAAGAGIDDVVELTTFHPEPRDSAAFQAEFEKYMPIHREFFGDHRPAWTAVGTTALLSPSAVVEMRVVAMIGSGKSSRVVFEKPPAEEGAETESGGDDPSDALP